MPTRGPLPPAVYRRRRLLVGGTAVLLVVATVDLVGDDDAPAAVSTADTARRVVGTPAPVEQPTPSGGRRGRAGTTGTPSTTPSPTPSPTPTPEPPDPVGACADDDVLAAPVMAPAEAGRPVLVTLSLRTVTAEACTWQVGRASLAYKITDADGDDVWSSSHCPGQVPTDAVVVRRDFPTAYRLAWSGRGSSRECPDGMELVPPGEYAVQAAAIGGEPSEVVPFTLVQAPATTEPDRTGGSGRKGRRDERRGADGTGAGAAEPDAERPDRERRRQRARDRDRAQT